MGGCAGGAGPAKYTVIAYLAVDRVDDLTVIRGAGLPDGYNPPSEDVAGIVKWTQAGWHDELGFKCIFDDLLFPAGSDIFDCYSVDFILAESTY